MRKPLVKPNKLLFLESNEPFKGSHKNCIGLMDPIKEKGVDYVIIWVHTKLNKRTRLETVAHEAIHAAYPDLTERQVIDGAAILAEALWQAGYRKH